MWESAKQERRVRVRAFSGSAEGEGGEGRGGGALLFKGEQREEGKVKEGE